MGPKHMGNRISENLNCNYCAFNAFLLVIKLLKNFFHFYVIVLLLKSLMKYIKMCDEMNFTCKSNKPTSFDLWFAGFTFYFLHA
jgi:hypothetical protein